MKINLNQNRERKNEITEKNQFRKPAEKFIENVNKTTAGKHHSKEEEMLNQDLNRHSSAKRKRKRYEGKKRARIFFVLIFFVIFNLKCFY